MRGKVLFIDTCHPLLWESLSSEGYECEAGYELNEKEIMAKAGLYTGMVIRSRFRIGKEMLDRCSSLKFIARVGAGMENIDVQYAEKKGIRCLHAPEGNRSAVAEHAAGMLLMLANNLMKADREVRDSRWIREGNRGWELEGRTLGIVGYGNMGSAFASRMRCFGMKILAHDKYKKGLGSDAVRECGIEELKQQADIISLHLPLSDETHHYVNDEFIRSCGRNFVLINTARGRNVDTRALLRGLESGKVAGACLDVLEYEKVSFEGIGEGYEDVHRRLSACGNVILSPHIAGWTKESNLKMAQVLAEKIRALGLV